MKGVQAPLLTKVANGAIWMVTFKMIERAVGLVSTLILVRLLVPHDFGLVAMGVSLIGILEMLTAFSFDIAIIRNREAKDADLNTAWTMGVLLGLAMAAAMAALAPFAADYYREPQVRNIVYTLALLPLLESLANVGIIAFRKELRFHHEFYYAVSKKLFGFAVTIPLAFLWRDYWALIWGMVAMRAFGVVVSYLAHPYRPRFSMAERGSIFHSSKWNLANNFLGSLWYRVNDLVIGRTLGAASLGLYNVSYEVSNLPAEQVSAPVNRALLPGFSAAASDPKVLQRMYLAAVSLILLFAVPAAAGIYSLAELLVPVVLGPRWLEATPIVQILAFSGALRLLESSLGTLLVSTGHQKDVSACTALQLLVIIASAFILIPPFGLKGAAYGTIGCGLLAVPVLVWRVSVRVGISPWLLLSAAIRPTVATIAMLAVMGLTLPKSGSVLLLLGGVALGATAYCVAIVLLWWMAGRPEGAERAVLNRLRGLLRPGGGEAIPDRT
jgi:O-antigen/teichoic acid export membrane protein